MKRILALFKVFFLIFFGIGKIHSFTFRWTIKQQGERHELQALPVSDPPWTWTTSYLVTCTSDHLGSWQSVWFMWLFELSCWPFCDPPSTTWIAGKVIQASMLNAVADILTLCTHQNAGVLTLLWLYNYSVDQSKAQKVARMNKCLNNIFAIRSFFCPIFSKNNYNFSFHVALKWIFSI